MSNYPDDCPPWRKDATWNEKTLPEFVVMGTHAICEKCLETDIDVNDEFLCYVCFIDNWEESQTYDKKEDWKD